MSRAAHTPASEARVVEQSLSLSNLGTDWPQSDTCREQRTETPFLKENTLLFFRVSRQFFVFFRATRDTLLLQPLAVPLFP